jgi:outer membrane protein OmpA-like peptidoglycan-associated protein
MVRQNPCIYKTITFLLWIICVSGFTYAQKYNRETDCYKNKKKNHFTVGDTLYTNCNFVWKPDSVYYDDFNSPLLDSLVVSLKKSPDIVVILNNWQPISKEVYDKMPKQNRSHSDAAMVKFTYVQANHIEYYLVNHGVQNCIISNGKGYKFYKNGTSLDADEKCAFATQVILTNRGVWHCISLEADKPVIMQNIYFDVDKWDIRPDLQTELDLFASYLNNHPILKIEISGHTDNTGDYKKNIELSQKRAEAVAAYLKTKFVTNTIETKGYGSSKPFRTNNTETGRAQNRRIEVKIIK